jgi:ABC-type spermidine/putrescine transport systems, ATPase components
MGEKDYINIINLSKSFGNVKALDNINLSINNGELLTILGPSGCGKTTLLKIIAGLEKPDTGDIFIDGFRINDVPPYKRNIGMVFQDLALFPHLNVIENIAFGLKIKKLQENEIKEKVSKILELVKLPIEEYGNRKLHNLVGDTTRVALAEL